MKTYLINGIDISDYVASEYHTEEVISISGEELLRIPSFEIDVFNEEGAFNLFDPTSLFYGLKDYQMAFVLLEEEQIIYDGIVRKLDFFYSENITRITVSSVLNAAFDRTCIYSNENLTPVQIFSEILQINGLSDYMDLHSYWYSNICQQEMGLHMDVCFLLDQPRSISKVFEALSALSGADIYISQGKLFFRQWTKPEDYNPALVLDADCFLGEIEFHYDSDSLRNQYVYKTSAGRLVDYTIGKESRRIWGERSYPEIDLSTGSLVTNALSALVEAGSNRILRAMNPKWFCRFVLNYDRFPYPFRLLEEFQLSPSIIIPMGATFLNTKWQVVGIKKLSQTMEITAVMIEE